MKRKIIFTLLFVVGLFTYASAQTVTGVVTDAGDGSPLIGVNIVEKGTTNGTITDVNGNYSLKTLGEGPVLLFSFIGYDTKEIPVNGQSVINVVLGMDASDLDEVVVVGYGVQKKSHLTGSISKVKNDNLDQLPVAQASEALTGKISGVTIQTTDGSAGSAPTIRVRGVGSITGTSDPLVVIDGNVDSEGLSNLDMNDVESIEVLKDAASAAIYGSRAANGVIMVTTKSGTEGKPTFSFNAYYGRKWAPDFSDKYMDVGEWNNYVEEFLTEYPDYDADEVITYNGRTLTDRAQMINLMGTETDWLDTMFDGGNIQSYSLSARGGNENSKYFVSVNYLNDEGVLLTDSYEKINLRLKLDTKLNKKLSFGANVNPSYTSKRDFPIGIHDALRQSPWLPLYLDEDNMNYVNTGNSEYESFYESFGRNADVGDYAMERFFDNYDLSSVISGAPTDTDISNTSNQNAYAKVVERDYRVYYFKLNSSAYLKYKLMKGLNFTSTVNVNYKVKTDQEWQGSLSSRNYADDTSSNYDQDIKYEAVNENIFTYDKTIGKHDFSAVAGMSWEYSKTKESDMEGTGYEYDYITTLNAATEISTAETLEYEETMHSVISRLNYAYGGKYLVSASARWDGSSRFGDDNKYGFFPAASFGWRLSEEDFLKGNDLISNLKLRVSYGTTGNKDGIELYQYLSLVSATTAVIDGSATAAFSPSNISNPDLKWEKSIELNAGIDVGLWNNRLNLGVDVYEKTSDDLLLEMDVPGITGFDYATVNKGEVKNSGVEIELNGQIISNSTLKWDASFNISFNKNELVDFAGSSGTITSVDSKRPAEYIALEGHPISSFYGYKYEKDIPLEYISNPLYPIGATPQDVYVKDLNGDGFIDTDDRTLLGSPYPTAVWGFTNSLNAYGFDFSFTVQGSHGGKVRNMDPQYYENQFSSKMDYTSDFADGDLVQEKIYTDLFVQDASFIALRNVNLGYTLPSNLLSKAGIKKARVYMSGSNLVYLMADEYTSFNPEGITDGDDSALTGGYQRGAAPITRALTFGVNLDF
jgi:TonB-linked SusC/RagA family outer membrane protein